MSVGSAFQHCYQALDTLPHCIDVTRAYCNRFCGILLVDGKYLTVKSYNRKIPVIYGVDYQTHDIPHYRLARSENYLTCKRFFESLKLANYSLQAVVCDDNQNIYQAATFVYPQVVIQLCHLHFLRNARSLLDLEVNLVHRAFWKILCSLLITKRDRADFEKRAAGMVRHFSSDSVCSQILIELAKKQSLLQGYLHLKGVPTTTNLIESLNSHLESRVRPLKGFESYPHANTWLNGYFLYRRTKPYTDCSSKFKRLNGKASLSQTQKPGMDIPDFFK